MMMYRHLPWDSKPAPRLNPQICGVDLLETRTRPIKVNKTADLFGSAYLDAFRVDYYIAPEVTFRSFSFILEGVSGNDGHTARKETSSI